ncbi:hypothetical protein MASR2M8_05580 [Opitutaceae bacterium]
MNIAHAFGFLAIGLIMLALPFVAPEWVASQSIYGSDGRTWWLFGMGGLQICGGLAFVVREGWRKLIKPRPAVLVEEREFMPAPVWARETFYVARRDLRPVRAQRASVA